MRSAGRNIDFPACAGREESKIALRWVGADVRAKRSHRDAQDVVQATSMPQDYRGALQRRADEMSKLKYDAGSSPKLGEFLKYAATGKVEQDHSRNVPLNLAAPPGDVEPPPAMPNASATELASMLRR